MSFFNFSSQNHPKKWNDKTIRCVEGRLIKESKTANTMVAFLFVGLIEDDFVIFYVLLSEKELKLHNSTNGKA